MKMKRKLAVLIALVLIAVLNIGCKAHSSEKTYEEMKANGKFVVGLDDNFPPMGFIDEKGELSGFDIDLAKEVGKRINLEVEFKPIEWDGVVMSLINKDIDVIWNGLTITEERKEKIDFSKAYLKNQQIIVVKEDSPIKNRADLKGKIVGAQLESSSANAIDKDQAFKESLEDTTFYGTNTEAFMDLKIGRIEGLVVDEILARYYISKSEVSYRILEDNLGEEAYGIGFRKGESEFIKAVNDALEEIKKDGTGKQISEKWFGKDIFVLEE